LGSGGYAEVMLYDQRMPSRKVAVKVMREQALSADSVARFSAEANAMAQLEHPHIVPIYSVGTTADNRQYIVMMYYPKPNLSQRVKQERLSVSEVLRIGIQIGSAVETAHRAGILHRDIKPANILTSQYGTPGLADFGIAGQAMDSGDDTGLSVPWSPPEVLYATSPASVRSDVYSLAATLWHLLVGRSPFEIPGGDNSTFAMMKRIRDNPAPATGRPDVPQSLDSLLRAAMSAQPLGRPPTMMDFVRALQSVEQELRYAQTPVIVPEQLHIDTGPLQDNLDPTRVKAPTVVAAAAPARGAQLPVAEPEEEAEAKPRWGVAVLGGVVVLLIIGIGIWLGSSTPGEVPPDPTVVTPTVDVYQPWPSNLTVDGAVDGDRVTISWTYDNGLANDTFQVRVNGTKPIEVGEGETSVELDYQPGMCVSVKVLRHDGTAADLSPADWPYGCLEAES
jgi:hypothetical protein